MRSHHELLEGHHEVVEAAGEEVDDGVEEPVLQAQGDHLHRHRVSPVSAGPPFPFWC